MWAQRKNGHFMGPWSVECDLFSGFFGLLDDVNLTNSGVFCVLIDLLSHSKWMNFDSLKQKLGEEALFSCRDILFCARCVPEFFILY